MKNTEQLPSNLFQAGFSTQNDPVATEDPIDPNKIQDVIAFIHLSFKEQKTINRSDNSYRLKHIVEHRIGRYVSNGELIASMIICGYEYKTGISLTGDRNALFNVNGSSVNKSNTYYGH